MRYKRNQLGVIAALLFIAAACLSALVSSVFWAIAFGVVGIVVLGTSLRPSTGHHSSKQSRGSSAENRIEGDGSSDNPDGWQKSVRIDSSLPHYHA